MNDTSKTIIAWYKVFCSSRGLKYPPTLGCSLQLMHHFFLSPFCLLSWLQKHNCFWSILWNRLKQWADFLQSLFKSFWFSDLFGRAGPPVLVSTQYPKFVALQTLGLSIIFQKCPPPNRCALPCRVLVKAFVQALLLSAGRRDYKVHEKSRLKSLSQWQGDVLCKWKDIWNSRY